MHITSHMFNAAPAARLHKIWWQGVAHRLTVNQLLAAAKQQGPPHLQHAFTHKVHFSTDIPLARHYVTLQPSKTQAEITQWG